MVDTEEQKRYNNGVTSQKAVTGIPTNSIDVLEVKNANPTVRINPNLIPSVEKTLLCATFLEAVIRFYQNPDNLQAFEEWCIRKGDNAYGSKNS